MIEKLSKGYERFRNRYFKHNRARLEQLAEKQAPQIAILSCRDSRVDPGDISNKLERYDREKR